jgi:hypothetical protein
MHEQKECPSSLTLNIAIAIKYRCKYIIEDSDRRGIKTMVPN